MLKRVTLLKCRKEDGLLLSLIDDGVEKSAGFKRRRGQAAVETDE